MITLGIGCAADAEKVLASAELAVSEDVHILCYSSTLLNDTKSAFVGTVISDQPHIAMIDDLRSGKIHGAVRGTLPANETLRYLKTAFGVSRLERIALLETAGGERFFLAPVGVDEGWTVEEKIHLVTRGRELARSFGLSDKTAVLSGGRIGDIGRHPIVDKSISDAIEVAEKTGAVHGEILIEDMVKECGVIIAPDGISGNLIFRTLTFLGAGIGHGAPVMNIPGVFIDSSRASSGYVPALNLTVAVVKKNM
ncbi:methanogenesis marker protein Mmp4/MtxX [uncultured Methanocorpusculum sp.]|nr:methanogenesis marker protein Mmp4/MtxX [uncultured Methanocorpusculum sp.]